MATTFSYVLFKKNARKDGSIPVKIRMIHNRTARYFPTAVFVTKDQLDRKETKIKDVRVTDTLDAIVKEYRLAAATVPRAEQLSVVEMASDVKAAMRKDDVFRLDFFEYADRKIAEMKPKTAEIYRTSMNALKRFVGSDTLDISEINHSFVLRFKQFLETEPPLKNGDKGKKYKAKSVGCRAISLYLSNLRAMFNRAIDEFNDDDYEPIRRLPFKRSTIPPQPVTKHRELTREQMLQILAYEPKTELQAMAKDVFLLSFYLIGMNTVDIYNLRKSDLKDGVLTYHRSKTVDRRRDGALMQVRVEREAEEILCRYLAQQGDALLTFSTRYATEHGFNGAVNKKLKDIMEGLETYHARHTWSTMARNECGVDFDTVHAGLVHAKTDAARITDIYIKRDFSKIWEANRKVIDYVLGDKKKTRRTR